MEDTTQKKMIETMFKKYIEISEVSTAWLNDLAITFKKCKYNSENYRPMSLLPVLYKLYAKIITLRL